MAFRHPLDVLRRHRHHFPYVAGGERPIQALRIDKMQLPYQGVADRVLQNEQAGEIVLNPSQLPRRGRSLRIRPIGIAAR